LTGKPASKKKSPSAGRRARDRDDARALALAIAEGALDKKALHVEIIDVRGKVDYADFVVVMSGSSDRHVNAIARGVDQAVQERGLGRCLGMEGLPQGHWVLMDFGDAIAHIFHEDTRGYYDLESLWLDAARVNLPV
jgi:ribosome-associated protein